MSALDRDIRVLRYERQKLLDERGKLDARIKTIEQKIAALEKTTACSVPDSAQVFQAAEADSSQKEAAVASGSVTESSSFEEKFELFRSLFFGRGDVFAKGYKGSNGKIAYSVVCTNLFNPKICARSAANDLRFKCADFG